MNLSNAAHAIAIWGQHSEPMGPLRLHFNANEYRLEFNWLADSLALSYRLEQASSFDGPWSTLTETADTFYVEPHRGGQGFYRLITILPDE